MKQASVGIAAHKATTANSTNLPLPPLTMVYSLIDSLS
jgi:hypothetical protein